MEKAKEKWREEENQYYSGRNSERTEETDIDVIGTHTKIAGTNWDRGSGRDWGIELESGSITISSTWMNSRATMRDSRESWWAPRGGSFSALVQVYSIGLA